MHNALSFDVDELEIIMRASVGLPPVDAPQFIVENTEYTLRMLKKYDVRATFFINGRSVTPQPGLIRRIADDGHEIAVHSFSHRFLGHHDSRQALRDDIEPFLDVIPQTNDGVIP